MIDLGTLWGLFEHDHSLAAYCSKCCRWSVLPLARLVAQCQGAKRLPVMVRCGESGTDGQQQVRPPVPRLDPKRRGWMEPS